jgi:hypothetical protein
MSTIKSGFACRPCYDASGENRDVVHVLAKEGSGFECERGHKYIDNEALMASNPLKVKLAKPAEKVQEGSVSLQVMVHSQLRDRLQQRFGDKLNASVASLLQVFLDPNAFVVCGPDQDAVEKIFQEPVRNSIELISKVGKLSVERDDAKREAEDLKKKNVGGAPLSENAFKLTVEKEVADGIREKARQNGMSPAEFISSAVSVAVKNGWF